MRVKYILILQVIALLIVTSCEKTSEMDLPETDSRMVVEGIITNNTGPYFVKLTRTQKYSFNIDNASIKYEKGATVIISDDMGISDTLSEISVGQFSTHPGKIAGKVGHSYKIDIFTNDGKHFSSKPEKMLPVPNIDSIFFNRDITDRSKSYPDAYKFNVYINWHVTEKLTNYNMVVISYFWNNKWQQQSQFNLLWYNNLPTENYNKIKILESYGVKFFLVKISMYALQKNAYEYWRILMREQKRIEINGYVNSTVPLAGNIINVSDPNDYALGYFQASATSEAIVDINW